MQTIKIPIVKPSDLFILIPFGLRDSPHDPNSLSLCFSHDLRENFSQPYSTTVNIIILYILYVKLLEGSQEGKSVWSE